MQNKRLVIIVVSVALLLRVPAIAMWFTDEVKWNWFDFMVAGVLLLGAGLTLELVLRNVNKIGPRLAMCAAVLVGLFVVWAELAVGIVGTPLAGN